MGLSHHAVVSPSPSQQRRVAESSQLYRSRLEAAPPQVTRTCILTGMHMQQQVPILLQQIPRLPVRSLLHQYLQPSLTM